MTEDTCPSLGERILEIVATAATAAGAGLVAARCVAGTPGNKGKYVEGQRLHNET